MLDLRFLQCEIYRITKETTKNAMKTKTILGVANKEMELFSIHPHSASLDILQLLTAILVAMFTSKIKYPQCSFVLPIMAIIMTIKISWYVINR